MNYQEQIEDYAAYLYTAYRAYSEGKLLASGNPIPEWEEMDIIYKNAWKATAKASLHYHPLRTFRKYITKL